MAHDRVIRDAPYPRSGGSMWAGLGPATHFVLRVGAGILFMEHGLQKMFGMLGGMGGNPGATAPIGSLIGLAGILELVGGILLILGLAARPAALVLTIEMTVAFAKAHLPKGGWPLENGGELALLYGLVFLFLLGNGAGPLSLDRTLGRRRTWPTDEGRRAA